MPKPYSMDLRERVIATKPPQAISIPPSMLIRTDEVIK
jgi:hypothetical protein